jgi:hypothetical protein
MHGNLREAVLQPASIHEFAFLRLSFPAACAASHMNGNGAETFRARHRSGDGFDPKEQDGFDPKEQDGFDPKEQDGFDPSAR